MENTCGAVQHGTVLTLMESTGPSLRGCLPGPPRLARQSQLLVRELGKCPRPVWAAANADKLDVK